MKFSNIVCVALLGATLSSSAYADTDISTSGNAYTSLVNFFNGLRDDVRAINRANTPIKAAATDSATDLSTQNKAFIKLLNDMFSLGKDVIFGNTNGTTLTSDGYEIIIKSPTNNTTKSIESIEIKKGSDSNTFTMNGDKLQVVKTGNGIINTTDGLSAKTISDIIAKLPQAVFATEQSKADGYLTSLKTAFEASNSATDLSGTSLAYVLNTENNADTVALLKNAIAAEAINIAKTNASGTSAATDLAAANKALAQSDNTITIGDTTYNGTTSKITADAIKSVANTNSVGTVLISALSTASISDLDTANKILDNFTSLIESNQIAQIQSQAIAGSNGDKGIKVTGLHNSTITYGTTAFSDDSLKKELGIKDLNKLDELSVVQVTKFANSLKKIQNDLKTAQDQTDTTKKLNMEKAALKEAIAAGLQFDSKTTQATTITEVPNTATAAANSGDGSVDQAVTNALKLFDSSKPLNTLLTNVDLLKKAYISRANAIANYNSAINGNAETSGAANTLGALSTNEVATDVLALSSTANVVSAVKGITQGTNQIASALNTKTISVLRNSNELSTSTRLAMLSNPYNAELGLASAVNKLGKSNLGFASMNDESLGSVIKEYAKRFESDANVWANVVGGKSVVKDGLNATVFGGNAGYDKRFDNTILGGYLGYAKSRASNSLNSVNSDNVELGVYGRTFIGNNEIDYKASLGLGKSKTNRNFIYITDSANMANQEGKFNSTFANLGATYGYVIDLGNSTFIKPLFGLDYSYAKNSAFDETDTNKNLPEHFGSLKNSELSAKLGVEFRKYLASGNYFYATPAVQTDLYRSKNNDYKVNYLGAKEGFVVPVDTKKATYFVLNTGLDLKITDSVSTNISFGTKVGSKAQYYNGTFGIRYAF